MRRVLSIMLFCIIALGTLEAQFLDGGRSSNSESNYTDSKATGQLSYCTNKISSTIGFDKVNNFSAAITFSAAKMNCYVGTVLTSIRVGLGKDASNAKVWIARTKDGARLYEQDFIPTDGWNTITLTTPYTIDAGSFAIGYDVTGTYVMGTSDTTQNAVNGGNMATDGKWTTLANSNLKGNLCIIGMLEGEINEVVDLGLTSVNPPKYLKTNTDFVIKGTVLNEGNITITSYDINYKINGEEPVCQSFTDVNIAPNATADFQLSTPLNKALPSLYDVEFSISNVNSKTTDDYAPNNVVNKLITIYSDAEILPRKIVLEHFTTEKCPNCPAAETTLRGIIEDNEDIIWVHNHSGFGTDQYTITEDYLWFYKSDIYAPAIMINRTNYAHLGALDSKRIPSPGPVFNVLNYVVVSNILQESLSMPAFVTININGEIDIANRKIDLTVSGSRTLGLPADNVVLTVWLIENNLNSIQTGVDKHHTVLRKIISNTWGDPITFDGNNYTKTYSADLDSEFVISEMSVVAFLSNYDENNPNNCEIFNGQNALFTGMSYTGENLPEELAINVYPNPAKDVITIEGDYKLVSIVDITGKVVKVANGESKIGISDLNNGIYMLSIVGEKATKVQKLVVNR